MTQEENKLVIAAQNGERSAFEKLVYRYDKNVLGIAHSFINNNEDAKDIYQEVFLRVFKGIKKFEFRSEFSTWLYRITTNVCLTYRSQKKKYAYTSLDEETEEDSNPRSLANTLTDNQTPDNNAMNSEISTRIENGLDKLSPQQRLVFTMKHYKGYKIKEISTMMNCSEGTIKNYLFIATQRMRDHLKDFMDKD
ncbi:MAG: RNA polymerase sigma factor [Ignavibacteriaceae bacterium]|jgi:RNA polymerase sigma-70 factor (ECF subfamily)